MGCGLGPQPTAVPSTEPEPGSIRRRFVVKKLRTTVDAEAASEDSDGPLTLRVANGVLTLSVDDHRVVSHPSRSSGGGRSSPFANPRKNHAKE